MTTDMANGEPAVGMDPRVGRVLQNRYQIIEKLAVGGMGVVYRGERLQLGRPVAIKFLHATFAVAPDARKRFEREAMATARLSHPNCVSVFDFGIDDDGSPYIVMDYITGRTLKDVLQEEGPLEPGRAVYIVNQILGALAYAHSQDMVHRDIKPANIILSNAEGAQDHVFILDFGLAKVVGSSSLSDLTASHVVLGTPSYMSPEQARGESTSAPSDVYSTGILIFELLTGQKLYESDNPLEVLMAHQNGPVPRLAERAPGRTFSDALEGAVKKALAKSVAERYATAVEFAEALSAAPEAKYTPRRVSSELSVARAASTITGKQKVKTRRTFKKTERLVSLGDGEGSGERSASDVEVTDDIETGASQSLSAAEIVEIEVSSAGNGAPPRTTNRRLPTRGSPFARLGAKTGSNPTQALTKPAPKRRSLAAYLLVLLPLITAAAVWAVLRQGEPNAASTPASANVATADSAAGTASAGAAKPPASGTGDSQGQEDPVKDPGTVTEQPAAADAKDATPSGPPEAAGNTAPEAAGEPATATAGDTATAGTDAEDKAPDAALTAGDQSQGSETPARVEVKDVADVEVLVKQGKREEAIRGIQKLLRTTHPGNPYLNYLLGNLYFEKVYWGDGLDAYIVAAKADAKYRKLSKLNQNAIRALSHDKSRAKVNTLYLRYIRRAGLPFLKEAAKSDKSPVVRKRAQALINQITRSR